MNPNPIWTRFKRSILLSGLLGLFSLPVAAELSGKVIKIADGDTLTVLVDREQVRIRLSGIDAPEKRQSYGTVSRQALADLAFGKNVTVQATKLDRYKRTVGKVIDDNGKDINLAMLEAGMAWHYRQYENEQSPADRVIYRNAEEVARLNRTGLWREVDPVAPWDFRRKRNETINVVRSTH